MAGYFYQSQPQLQSPFGLAYDGYHHNYQTYQSAPAVQYYTSNHIQAPPPAPVPFGYQSPVTSYFQRPFLQPQPIYNVQPPTYNVQQPAPVLLRESRPVLNSTAFSTANTSPQIRGFLYHTDLQGGAHSNVVFFSGPAPANLFHTSAQAEATTMRTPASDSADAVAVDTPATPVDNFQSILALLNQQPSSSMFRVQDGILYSGLSSNNRVVTNNRFLSTDDDTAAEDALPILRSSFIGQRVTSPDVEVPEGREASASERQSKSIEVETSSERNIPDATTTTTPTAASTTTTTAAASTASSSSTTTTAVTPTSPSTMAPIVVAEMTET